MDRQQEGARQRPPALGQQGPPGRPRAIPTLVYIPPLRQLSAISQPDRHSDFYLPAVQSLARAPGCTTSSQRPPGIVMHVTFVGQPLQRPGGPALPLHTPGCHTQRLLVVWSPLPPACCCAALLPGLPGAAAAAAAGCCCAALLPGLSGAAAAAAASGPGKASASSCRANPSDESSAAAAAWVSGKACASSCRASTAAAAALSAAAWRLPFLPGSRGAGVSGGITCTPRGAAAAAAAAAAGGCASLPVPMASWILLLRLLLLGLHNLWLLLPRAPSCS
jgi:hypothetical protein